MPVELVLGVAAMAIVSALVGVLALRALPHRAQHAGIGADRTTLARQLTEVQSRLDALLAVSGTGIVAFDAAATVRYANAAAGRLVGIDASAIPGSSAIAVLRDHAAYAMLNESLADRRVRTTALTLGAQGRALEMTILPLENAGDWSVFLLLDDVSELQRLETVRRDFVSNVSHELRTPLASIRAVVETLQAGALEEPELARDFLERAVGEVDRLTELVDELTELGRIESGQVPFRFEVVDPRDLIDECVRRLAPQAERAGVSLRAEPGPEVPPIRADRERLGRALLNLVHNAIKFTHPGGSVAVRANVAGDHVELTVQDTGVGIPAAEVGRIFERFYKVEKSRGGAGTGLGLAIVKHTAEGHGGSVAVRSAPGQGSTFSIRLPAWGEGER